MTSRYHNPSASPNTCIRAATSASIAIVRPDARGKPISVPAFVPLRVEPKEAGTPTAGDGPRVTEAVSVGQVLSDEERRGLELRAVFGYVYCHRKRLEQFEELQPLVRLMDKIRADLEKQQATAAASRKLPLADGAPVAAVAG